MNKFVMESRSLLTNETTTQNLEWKHLIEYLKMDNTEYIETIVYNGEYHTNYKHIFELYSKGYDHKIIYDNTVIN